MQVMERDLSLLNWINSFGFVTCKHVGRWMNVSDRVAQKRVKKLVDGGYLERERIFCKGGDILKVSNLGVKLIGDELGVQKGLRLGTYFHDLGLIDLSLDLVEEHNGSRFFPERRIRHEIGLKGVGQSGHIPDGFLELEGGQRIAIELEITRKQKFRLKRILRGLHSDMNLAGVWYFCPEEIADFIAAEIPDPKFFQVKIWGGFQNA